MGCSVCKPHKDSSVHSSQPNTSFDSGQVGNHPSEAVISQSPKNASKKTSAVNLPISELSTIPSPTRSVRKNDTVNTQAKITNEPTSAPSRDSIKALINPKNVLSTLQVTPDSSVVAETSPKVPAKSDQKNASRDILTCRLKHSDILETYDISSNYILGTGISGAVRVARHIPSGRQFAIKTLSLEGVGAKKAAMLHNEVSIYLKLDHPNIAKLIEVFENNQNIHLVMELCTGGELYDKLAAKKKYSEADAAHVTRQMLSAINYCHKHRICHRDLKLENWVYADQSEDAPLKLIDFGFSRIFNPGVPMTAMHGTVYYVSPEVMDGCYQEKCDIWSIGVIVYMLLSGSPPFNGSYDHEILVKIKRGSFSFSGPRWEGISDLAKQFILYLLCKDPDIRPSAEDALKHPWLQRDGAADHDIDLSVVKSMRNFALGNVLRRAALGVVALAMTSREVEELEKAFKALDKTNRGTIQLQELANVLVDKLSIDTAEAQSIFEKIDQTGKREVHYSEFIASTLQAKIIKDDGLLKEAFQRFDVDKKGYITLENLRAVVGDTYNGSRVEEIMELCDSNQDGVIDFAEFYKALTSDEAALSEIHPESDISRAQSDDSKVRRRSISQLTNSAFTALQSMRKATYLSAVSDVEKKNNPFLDARKSSDLLPS